MKIKKSLRFESLCFLLMGAIFFSIGVEVEKRMFIVWGIISLFFAAAIFLIHTFSKRETKTVYVYLYSLFLGCLIIYAGLFELRDKLLILVGGAVMALGVLSGFLLSSEERRREDERFRKGIRLPDEYIILFAVKESEENDDLKWYVIDKRTGIPYVFAESKYAMTDFGTVRMLACSKYARCFMVDEMKKRSFWADFSEDNWWKKLKIKFDKTQSKKEKIEKLSRKIVTANLKDGIRYIFGRFLGGQAQACFPDEPHCDFVELMMDLKERKIIANIASYDGRRDFEITMTADEMHEIAINNGIGDIVFMEKEDDWKTLFDNCEEHLRSINEGSTASSVKPPLLSKKKVDVDVAENRYRVLERTVNVNEKEKLRVKFDGRKSDKSEAESKNEETQLNKSATKSNAPEKKKVSSGLFEITTEQQEISCESFECEVRTADVRSDRRESGIDERKVASKLAIKLSKEYYYIGNDNSFWLFLSRNRETLLGIYALSYQKEYIEFETKKVAVSEYTIDSSECVGKVIADCFGRSMKELDCEQLFRILYSVMGYEYISSRRLETLFSLKDKEISWEYYENISYDRATGQPYFVRERVRQSGHGWISYYSVNRISYDEVAKEALVYAPASKFINISDTNWREILDFTPDGDDLSTTYTYTTGKLNETSMFDVFVSFDEHNEYLYKKRLQRDLCPEQIHGLTETYKDSDISGLMKYDAECMQRIDKIAHSDQKNMTFPNMNYSVNKLAGRKLLEAIRKGEFEKFLMAAPGYRFDTDRNFPEMNNYSEQFHALNEYGKSNREFENELIQALRNCLKERGRFGYAYHIVRIICEQVLYERNGKNSMDFITDDLLKELREMILLNKEKLMDYKEWDGKLYEDGMYGALKYHCDFISTVSGDKYKIL